MKPHRLLILVSWAAALMPCYGDLVDASWQHAAPREEIAPHFTLDAKGGRDGRAALVIEADGREGLSGQWLKTVPVQGGKYYRFSAWRKTDGVAASRRSAVARILWQDDVGKPVPHDGPI